MPISITPHFKDFGLLDRYKKNLDYLLTNGERLYLAIRHECFPEEFSRAIEKQLGDKANEYLTALPSFAEEYQSWYSEAMVLIKQLLPDRLSDFIRHYEKPKPRKEITYENYRIEDYLQGLTITRGPYKETIVGLDAAIGGYVNRCVNDIRRRPSQPLAQRRFHPRIECRDRRLRSTQGPSDA